MRCDDEITKVVQVNRDEVNVKGLFALSRIFPYFGKGIVY